MLKVSGSISSSSLTPLWSYVWQQLTMVEIGVLGFIVLVMGISGWRQLNRRGVLRIVGGVLVKAQWALVTVGVAYLLFVQVTRIGGSLWRTFPLIIDVDSFSGWEIARVGIISLATVIVMRLPWASILPFGGRPGQSKEARQISNQIYITSPESLASTIQKELAREGSSADNGDKLLRKLEQVLGENATTQKLILGQLAAVNKYIESLHMTLPSANFLAFSLDEMSSRIEERLDDIAVANVGGGDASNHSGSEIGQVVKEQGNREGKENKQVNRKEQDEEGKQGAKNRQIRGRRVDIEEDKDYQEECRSAAGTDEQSLAQEEPEINVANAQWKRVKKDPIRKQQAPKGRLHQPISQEEVNQYAEMSEEELFEALQKKRRERREEAKKPVFLTEEERSLPIATLDKRWREQEQQERTKRRRQEEAELGVLTEEEKRMPKSELKFLIRQKKQEAWIKRMQNQNVPLFRCEVCSQITTSHHRCAATSWAIQGVKRLVPITEEIIFQQVGAGDIRIKKIQRTDNELIQKQHQALSEQLKKAEEQNQRLNQLLANPTVESPKDHEMDVIIDPTTSYNTTQVPIVSMSTPVATPYQRTFYQQIPTFLHPPC